MKFVFSADKKIADALEEALKEIEQNITDAAQGAVKDTAAIALKEGRANIRAARFRHGQASKLRSKFFRNKGRDPAALVFDTMPFAVVFERGITISGHPLLWLPIEKNLPPNIKSPKQYGKKLISVNIAGRAPLLFDPANRLIPLFVGLDRVELRKRTNLYQIFLAAAEKMRDFYEERLKDKG